MVLVCERGRGAAAGRLVVVSRQSRAQADKKGGVRGAAYLNLSNQAHLVVPPCLFHRKQQSLEGSASLIAGVGGEEERWRAGAARFK